MSKRQVRLQTADANVSQLELFFDLVFVFALTRVTDLLADEPTSRTVIRSVLLLAVLWWCWVGYSWLGNVARADEGVMRVAMFSAMGASFVAALTIPEAFTDLPGGLSGPIVFAVAYLAVRLIHLFMFWIVADGDRALRGQLLRWIPSIMIGTGFLLAASQTTGSTQTLLWLAALVGDYVGTFLAGTNWRLNSARHFAERHGLIIIVALGESIVSIGIGVLDLPISWPIIAASLLGLAVSGLLWWSYFDSTSVAAEHALATAGERQISIARNCYSFAHLPMVIGIIGLSLGLKKILSYSGDAAHHSLTDVLHGIPLYLLFGGPALYLFALVLFKYGATGSIGWLRIGGAAILLCAIPLAAQLPALAALGLLTALLTALVGYESLRYRDFRHEIRQH